MSDDIFELYTSPNADPELLVEEKEPYQAVVRGKDRQLKLLMYGRNGQVIGMPSYAYYMDIVCESHQSVSLIFTQYVYLIAGRNLMGLIPLLQNDRVRILRCFNKDYLYEPAADEPVIDRIHRMQIKELAKQTSNKKI